MMQREPCDSCGQKASCQEVFRQLGNIRGKSVARSILAAFVLPLVVFIAALAAAQRFLTRYIDSAGLRAAVALLLAIAAAAVCVTTVRIIGKRLGRK
ncbi:MAG: SoxR reducing system RseC family protein [Planctomycetota bacterium]